MMSISTTPAEHACAALDALRVARDHLKAAGATQTLARVRLAITSCGGAVRHAQGKGVR